MTVDAERLLSAFLRSRSEITALVEDRVYTDLPSRPVFPLVRIQLIGGAPRFSLPLYLDDAVLQIDCYGGPKVQARQLVDTVRALAASSFFRTVHAEGVVSNVDFGGLQYLPDVEFDPPKPRYVAELTITSHP